MRGQITEEIQGLAKEFLGYDTVVANACLIASAPDMYEALKEAQQDINWMLNNQQYLNPDRFEYIDKALAKAEGK